jgi:lipoate-protein ligase A
MDDFTYCLVLPTSAGIDREECFALAAGGLTGALALLDVPSAVATHEPAGRRSRWCFESAFGVDIESRGRKVCGSAQRVYRDSILQHGTLILSGGHGAMLDSLGQEGAENVLLPLDEAAGHPVTWNEVRHALEESFSKGIGLELEPAWMDAHEDKYVRDLLDETRAAKGL